VLVSSAEIIKTDNYEKALKKLKKRFRNIELNVEKFLDGVSSIGDLGVSLGAIN